MKHRKASLFSLPARVLQVFARHALKREWEAHLRLSVDVRVFSRIPAFCVFLVPPGPLIVAFSSAFPVFFGFICAVEAHPKARDMCFARQFSCFLCYAPVQEAAVGLFRGFCSSSPAGAQLGSPLGRCACFLEDSDILRVFGTPWATNCCVFVGFPLFFGFICVAEAHPKARDPCFARQFSCFLCYALVQEAAVGLLRGFCSNSPAGLS